MHLSLSTPSCIHPSIWLFILHLSLQLSYQDAFQYCQAVHDLRQCPVVVGTVCTLVLYVLYASSRLSSSSLPPPQYIGSPQTQQQRNQVIRVITQLSLQNRLQEECDKLQLLTTCSRSTDNSPSVLPTISSHPSVFPSSVHPPSKKLANTDTHRLTISTDSRSSSLAVDTVAKMSYNSFQGNNNNNNSLMDITNSNHHHQQQHEHLLESHSLPKQTVTPMITLPHTMKKNNNHSTTSLLLLNTADTPNSSNSGSSSSSPSSTSAAVLKNSSTTVLSSPSSTASSPVSASSPLNDYNSTPTTSGALTNNTSNSSSYHHHHPPHHQAHKPQSPVSPMVKGSSFSSSSASSATPRRMLSVSVSSMTGKVSIYLSIIISIYHHQHSSALQYSRSLASYQCNHCLSYLMLLYYYIIITCRTCQNKTVTPYQLRWVRLYVL